MRSKMYREPSVIQGNEHTSQLFQNMYWDNYIDRQYNQSMKNKDGIFNHIWTVSLFQRNVAK